MDPIIIAADEEVGLSHGPQINIYLDSDGDEDLMLDHAPEIIRIGVYDRLEHVPLYSEGEEDPLIKHQRHRNRAERQTMMKGTNDDLLIDDLTWNSLIGPSEPRPPLTIQTRSRGMPYKARHSVVLVESRRRSRLHRCGVADPPVERECAVCFNHDRSNYRCLDVTSFLEMNDQGSVLTPFPRESDSRYRYLDPKVQEPFTEILFRHSSNERFRYCLQDLSHQLCKLEEPLNSMTELALLPSSPEDTLAKQRTVSRSSSEG